MNKISQILSDGTTDGFDCEKTRVAYRNMLITELVKVIDKFQDVNPDKIDIRFYELGRTHFVMSVIQKGSSSVSKSGIIVDHGEPEMK